LCGELLHRQNGGNKKNFIGHSVGLRKDNGGGYGTWNFICKRPDMFAAALPVVGGGDRSKLIIKEKGLLFVEQPSQNFGESTGCSAIGI
jgi:hypothetical protein